MHLYHKLLSQLYQFFLEVSASFNRYASCKRSCYFGTEIKRYFCTTLYSCDVPVIAERWTMCGGHVQAGSGRGGWICTMYLCSAAATSSGGQEEPEKIPDEFSPTMPHLTVVTIMHHFTVLPIMPHFTVLPTMPHSSVLPTMPHSTVSPTHTRAPLYPPFIQYNII